MAKPETKFKNLIKEMKETIKETTDQDEKKFRELQLILVESAFAVQGILDCRSNKDCTEDEANAAIEAYLGKMLRLNMVAEDLAK